jgi:hypothetical protein
MPALVGGLITRVFFSKGESMEKRSFFMKNKLYLVCISALILSLALVACDDDPPDDGNNPPVLQREKAGLGKTYQFTNLQVYDESNRNQKWNGNITALALGYNSSASNIGSVTNGKLSVTLPELAPAETDSGVTVTSNENNVNFLLYWAFDNWAGGSQGASPRYRIRLWENHTGYAIRWVLIYADKAGIVKAKTNDDAQNTLDMDLVEGWNVMCNSGSSTNFVTHTGITNALPYYDGVGK